MKKEFRFGLILLGIYLILTRFLNTPDLVLGFLMGLSVLLMLIGLLPEKMYRKLKQLKGEN